MAQSNYLPVATHTDAEALAYFQGLVTAMATLNSGNTEPPEVFENMIWYDLATDILKVRRQGGAGWFDLFQFDQGAGQVSLAAGLQFGASLEAALSLKLNVPTAAEISAIGPTSGTAFVTPAGGSYFVWAQQFNPGTGALTVVRRADVYPGATSIGTPGPSFAWTGFYWKVA